MPPIGTGTRLGPYEITGLLGAGGMGQVFRARDTRLGRDVAVKVLMPEAATDPDRRARFNREARAIAVLGHPHICTIHDVGVEGGVDYLVLELLEGESLAARLRRGPLPLDDALARAIEIAGALDRAHRAGVVHRDVKPGNVMLTPSGAKVLDFGLARITRGDSDSPAFAPGDATASLTQAGVVLGTVQDMAPEQIEGDLVDARADVFAFGATLFEMVTGRRAFDASSVPGMVGAIVRGETPSVLAVAPNLPASLDRIIRLCLEKDAAKRFASLHDVALALRWLQDDAKGGWPGEAPAGGAVVRSGRAWYVVAAIAALAVAGLTATWTLSRPAPESAPVSFIVGPPTGVEWSDLPPEPVPSVSPDGRRIAFSGLSTAGRGVWVRDLGSVQARFVPGSTELGGPGNGLFWSADSTRVGYCAGGRLKLHTLDERPPTLLEADCVSGVGSVNDDGEILYRGPKGISLISERGGTPRPVTIVDASRQQAHNFPRWLPGGQRFVFTAIGPEPDAAGIFAGTLDGAPPTRILPDVSKSDVVVGPAGTWNLVFVRERNLVVQPIDKTSLAPAGEARTLAASMAIGNSAMPSFSASATLLVYRSRSEAPLPEWGWFDRRGAPASGKSSALKGASAAALSPDGSFILYTPVNRGNNSNGIWTLDEARRVERPLEGVPLSAFQPSFSKDGRRIAFARIEPGFRRLYVMPFPDGPPMEIATDPTLGLIGPEWSADGSTLIGCDNSNRIVAIRLDSPQRVAMLVPNGSQPQLSPDGRWLAYTSAISGTPEVYVQKFPEGTDRRRVSLAGGAQPRWGRGGKELFYATADSTIMSLPVRTNPQFEAGPPSRLFREALLRTDTTPFDYSYLPSPDGQRFLLRLPPEGRIPMTAVTRWLTR